MENVIKNRFNCYNMSTIGDGSIINFNNDNSSDILYIWPYPYLFLNFIKFNETHYQWCGSMLLIVEYFAKFTKIK